MTRQKKFLLFLAAPWLLLVQSGCDIDHGLAPITTKIRGKVEFSGPAPLGNVSEVRVAAAKIFPPVNLTSDLLYSNQLEINRDTSRTDSYIIDFEISATEGEYPAVGVLWREGGKSWEITNILGLYTDLGSLGPKPITVTAEGQSEEILIPADWGLSHRTAFIEGDIHFKGEWPADTELLAAASFPIIPNPDNPFDFLTLQSLNIAIPTFVDGPIPYRLRVPVGTHKFISVFYKGRSGGLFDIRAVGFHSCPDDSTMPRAVTVGHEETASDIDIIVDLESLPAGARYSLEGGECGSQ